jgi:hypothetical protein
MTRGHRAVAAVLAGFVILPMASGVTGNGFVGLGVAVAAGWAVWLLTNRR